MNFSGTKATVLALGLVGGALSVWAYSEQQVKRRRFPRKRRVLVDGGHNRQRYMTLP